MSITDAVSRIGQIQDQITSLRVAFTPPAAATASPAGATGAQAAGMTTALASPAAASATGAATGTTPTSFSDVLSSAMSPAPTGLTAPTGPTAATGAAGLPTRASSLLTSDQQQFAARLAADTGLDSGVVSAWLLAEESGGAAASRQSASNNDWLNIGYTGSGTFGAADAVWSDPVSAADATAGWLRGQNTIPGYGTASSGIQAILATAGQPPAVQISALQTSGWAGSGYPDLPSLYAQVAA
jgi:hypothetical protein